MDIESIKAQIADDFADVEVKAVKVKNHRGVETEYTTFTRGTTTHFLTAAEMAKSGFDLASALRAALPALN